MNYDSNFYPDAFPPLLKSVTLDLQRNCGVPIELAAPLVLSAASLACQGSVDVRRPNCEPSPCSLYTLLVAGSGTRKSTVIKKLFAPFYEIEAAVTDQNAVAAPEYEAASLTWELRKKALVNQAEQEAKKNEVSSALREELTAHFAARPTRPAPPKFVYEDPTSEAMFDGLWQRWPSSAVVSSEAATFLNGRASHDLPLWNRIWDGAGVGVERVGRGAVFNRAARGSLVLAVQERPFEEFCESRGIEAMDIGFLARFLIARPPSSLGTRVIQENDAVSEWTGLTKFHARVKEILYNQYSHRCSERLERVTLQFSTEAKLAWIKVFNQVESQMQLGKPLATFPGYASKICENVARVAAIFHFFEGREGNLIQERDVASAERIVYWHTSEFLKCFGKRQLPVEQSDVEVLEEWLCDSVWTVGHHSIQKNLIRQYGPNRLRNKARLDGAIGILISKDVIRICMDSRKTRIVELNPNYFNMPRWRGTEI